MRSHPWLSAITFCLLVVGGLATAKYLQISALMAYAESFPPENQSVSVSRVVEGEYQDSTMLSAQTLAPNDMIFIAEVAGRISQINALPGSKIKANDILLQLDDGEEKANLKAAQARLRLAEISLKRSKTLNDKSLNSQEQVDIAEAQRNAALADIEYIEALIRKKKIISPIAGNVGLHQLNPGEYVNAGQQLLRVVDQEGEIWIDFHLPQTIPEPQMGSVIDVFDSQDQFLGTAKVIASDAWVAQDTRNKRIRLLFDNRQAGLSSGVYVKVKLTTGIGEKALVVPTTSVRRDTQGAFIFAVIASEEGAFLPHRAQQRRVEIIAQQGDNFLINGNLQADEMVATLGAFKLKDQIFVNVSSLTAGE